MKTYSADYPAPSATQGRTRPRPSAWKIGNWIVFGLFAILMGRSSPAQEVAPKQVSVNRGMKRPPLPHLYMHFLLYQNHLDRAAAAHEEQGKDGSWLRDHFQQQLGFTYAQFGSVRSTGVRLESELKQIGAEAMAIVQADRAARLENTTASKLPNSQLADLTKQRENLIQREIDSLNRELGPEASAKLQDFLENHFLQNRPSLHPHLRSHPAKRLQPQPASETVR